ncbi:hypothetical protein [Dyella japonica]|uniref:hypothetical protein n=1 Tax=Dyella japonica TaxID=231455 RepID=UPI0012E078F0|nr:hypothetical protein [Dyella japonica]
MSKNSKAKRDAKRKKAPKRTHIRKPNAVFEPHGEMRDGAGRVIAGVGKQGDDWLLIAGGQVLAGGSSAADVMAMLDQLAAIRQADGDVVLNSYSTTFRACAERDAAEEGMTLYEYIEQARAEMANSAAGSSQIP